MSDSGLSPPNGDENRQGGILATTFIVTILASVAVTLRMATRKWIIRSVGWDDYTILFAAFGIIIGCGLVVVQVHYGLGRHKFYLTQWQYIEFTKYAYGEWIQTFQTLMFNKISICFFLLRIPVEKHFIRPIQGTIIVLVISNIVLTLLWIFQCNPVGRAWNKQTHGICFTDAQLQRIIISQALISIISDFILALFPIVLLWKVQIELRIKAGLCILMGLGLMYALSFLLPSQILADLDRSISTAACCVVRTVLNWQNVNSDPTWESVDNWYWRSCEVCIGIIAACIPALRPGYKTVSAGIASYLSHRSSRRTSGSALVNTRNPSEALADQKPNAHSTHDQAYLAKQIAHPRASFDTAFGAAAQAASAEADRAKAYGAGEDGFAMNHLPGDKETGNQGIKKFTRIGVGGTTADGTRESLDLGDSGRGFGNREFV